MLALKKTIFFDWKPKMTKKFEFQNLKIPYPEIWPFWGIFKFKFFVIFGFPSKKIAFFKANILLSYQKSFGLISSIEEKDIL